ncbi:MAG TPA: M14 family metallopeptidase [Gaiellaceae bacterium]|nr:M14 family metallopeptidase [Gaiellaceae bacterium]
MGARVPTGSLRRRLAAAVLLALVCALVPVATPAAAAEDEPGGDAVVEVILDDRAALDRLVASGADLTHELATRDGAIVAQVVVDADGLQALRDDGYRIGRTLWTQADTDAVLAERAATIAAKRQQSRAAASRSFLAGADEDTLTLLRSDTYTNLDNGRFLYVEVKTSAGSPTSTQPTLTLSWDSGPGTAIGSGGSITMQRFVDAGVYMYHLREVSVATRPDRIRITSTAGGSLESGVNEWLPIDQNGDRQDPYFTDFVDHYLTPQELYARIEQLHRQYPDLTDIVELPYPTNGYQRKAMASMSGTTPIGNSVPTSAQPSAVYLESLEWGHRGGNDVMAEFVNPGTANAPLTVFVLGTRVTVNLATNAAGASVSTAAQVVAAINASSGASQLLFARTYAGNAGAGIVQPRALVNLSDFLSAPPEVRRGPQTVKLLRIGRHRDGSRTGVFIYAQEHAREWVPPQITIETAERLLRNYAHDGRTKQLVNNLDIFILPSVNPDGGTLSFYDRPSQRRNMTRHCPLTATSGMPSGRNGWGVDVNRNYDVGSLFDGYFGASTSCTSDTYSGPSELSEPESSNVDWVPATFRNIKFSMNTHSSGNLFMWSPGAYIVPGRITLPRPDLGTETFFWSASTHILTEIKRFRNLAVEPTATGPVVDVLYSAAGNSGDELFYKYGIFGWDFEVGGAGFQPQWAPEGHAQTMEFANGMTGILDVAYAWTFDHQRPDSKAVSWQAEDGSWKLRFDTSEPATVFYTLDGSRPTLASAKYAASGFREPPQVLTVPAGTTVGFFSADMAGNVENNYRPDGSAENFNKARVG